MDQNLITNRNACPADLTATHLCQLATAFVASLDVAQSSRTTYRRALKAFFDWLGSTGRSDHLDGLSRIDVLAYKDHLGKSVRVATANMYLFIVRSFFSWLEEYGVRSNIARGVKTFKKMDGHSKDCLTVEQVRRILEGIDRSRPRGQRDYAMINLMARTGLREIEVARARISDIRDEGEEPVLWVQGKGRAEADAFVLLVPAAMEPIREWLGSHRSASADSALFMSLSRRNHGEHMTSRAISKIVKDAMRRVGIDSDRLTPHSLRHTAISLAIAGGATLAQAQAMARHASPNTTMVYFHNAQRVREAAEKCVNF